jgi:hypothetical protein
VRWVARTVSAFVVLGLSADMARGQAQRLPEGHGLSAKYPKDAGIGRDSSVLFAENFEAGALEDVFKRWTEVSNKGGKVVSLSQDVPPTSAGKRSVQLTANVPENTGGHLYARLKKGVDRVFARFYVKFPQDADYIHHFVHMGGYNPPTNWPQGGAGDRPGRRAHDRRH